MFQCETFVSSRWKNSFEKNFSYVIVVRFDSWKIFFVVEDHTIAVRTFGIVVVSDRICRIEEYFVGRLKKFAPIRLGSEHFSRSKSWSNCLKAKWKDEENFLWNVRRDSFCFFFVLFVFVDFNWILNESIRSWLMARRFSSDVLSNRNELSSIGYKQFIEHFHLDH